MAMIDVPGYWWPKHPQNGSTGAATFSSLTIDAAGETVNALIYAPKSGELERVEFRVGTVTFNAASVLRVSFQDLVAGSAAGVQEQYRDITTGITTDTWVVPGRMTSNGTDGGTRRTVVAGEELAVRFEFQTFTAADSVTISTQAVASSNAEEGGGYPYMESPAGKSSVILCGALVYSDGSVYPIEAMHPFLSHFESTFNSGSTPDERGNAVCYPLTVRVEQAWVRVDLDANAPLVIYDAASVALQTIPMVNTTRIALDGRARIVPFPTPFIMTAGATYYVTVKPGGSSVAMYGSTAGHAGLWPAMPGHDVTNGFARQATRANEGAWTVSSTAWSWLGLYITGIDVPAAGGAVAGGGLGGLGIR